MNSLIRHIRLAALWTALPFSLTTAVLGQGDDRLVGVWALDEGFQIVELLFRTDGRYQRDTRSTDPSFDFASTEGGRYAVNGQLITLTPYEYFGTPEGIPYAYHVDGVSLTLERIDFPYTQVYQYRPGSRQDVLARQAVVRDPVGTWRRHIQFAGEEAFTFRPGGYYLRQMTPEGGDFPPELVRGRYEENEHRLTLKPYSGVEASYELDFFGHTLTFIRAQEYSGDSATYEWVPGSGAEVRAKAAEAEAFLSRPNWQVGIWEIRDPYLTLDLTVRPDGHYIAENHGEFLAGIVRGGYALEPGWIHLLPFVGQDIYARSNGDFGKVSQQRALDYYDGELQFIDLGALSQSVAIARKRAGSEAAVLEETRLAQLEREREHWEVGTWEVEDPLGWMEFTFRPDGRYLAQAGTAGVATQVERGRYVLTDAKLTLAPYAGLGEARGFELDLYDGALFLVGDWGRMVVAHKVPGSEAEVSEKTRDPEAMKGERGSILGRWTANLPGQSAELVFRPDGQFRVNRCQNNVLSHDYGLYSAHVAARSLVYDSRFISAQNLSLDFYGDTLTLFGGSGPPRSFTVNLGTVDQAIATSFAADADEAQVDAEWLARVSIGQRDPNAVHTPTGDIPADPRPGAVLENPTVFTQYKLYRRLAPGFVYFNEGGTIKSQAVVNTREWHFFPTGRVLVRFKNHRAGPFYPTTITDVTDNWGAYRIDPKPELTDILHLYADNVLWIVTDLGEPAEMTLEDGRRHLFWGKDYMILSEWAAEQQPVPCQPPQPANPRLMNTGLALSTRIAPDAIPESGPLLLQINRPASGQFNLTGTTTVARRLVLERATQLGSPTVWQPLQTNHVSAGPFSFTVPPASNGVALFRVRGE
jgi:hypothetical protein